MDSIIKKAGIMQVIFTVEPDPENEMNGIMTFWTMDGAKIGSLSVKMEARSVNNG